MVFRQRVAHHILRALADDAEQRFGPPDRVPGSSLCARSDHSSITYVSATAGMRRKSSKAGCLATVQGG